MSIVIDPMESRLLFVIGAPRSGTTLLMRMLSSHSAIYSRAEPHLLTPLAHLGFYDSVDAAPFDHLQAAQATREFVAELPRGEQDYLDACRAYADILYGRMLAARGQGKPLFLDKTPANGLILPFIAKLYPQARFVVLTDTSVNIDCGGGGFEDHYGIMYSTDSFDLPKSYIKLMEQLYFWH